MIPAWNRSRKPMAFLASAALALSISFSAAIPSFAAASEYAGGSGIESDPWHIRTAAQFNNIRNHLDGYFVLDNDIDLSGYENFQPIGAYVESAAEEEQADPAAAFSGIFDGHGHTISNLKMNGSADFIGFGMFGVVSGNGVIQNLTVKNVDVTGTAGNGGIGGVVGLVSGDAILNNISLVGNNNVTGNSMVGGLVGSANNKLIANCSATANVTLTGTRTGQDYPQCAGVLVGGDEGASLVNDHADAGTVTALGAVENETGINGLGGLAGCAIHADAVLSCTSKGVTINAGDYANMIGGLVGFSGRSDGHKTTIWGCTASDTVINAPATAERIGGIIGGGFYMTAYNMYYSVPTSLDVINCNATASVTNGCVVGSIAGYLSDDSTVSYSNGTMTLAGVPVASQVGGTVSTVPVSTVGGK